VPRGAQPDATTSPSKNSGHGHRLHATGEWKSGKLVNGSARISGGAKRSYHASRVPFGLPVLPPRGDLITPEPGRYIGPSGFDDYVSFTYTVTPRPVVRAFRTFSDQGHGEIVWDPVILDEVRVIGDHFESLKNPGRSAYGRWTSPTEVSGGFRLGGLELRFTATKR
jgi:hypothetical protein